VDFDKYRKQNDKDNVICSIFVVEALHSDKDPIGVDSRCRGEIKKISNISEKSYFQVKMNFHFHKLCDCQRTE